MSFIGIGTKIIQNIRIGTNVTIGAGTIVHKDISSNTKYYNSQNTIINEKK